MNKPYADEAPMRRVGPLLVVLLAALALILASVAALDRLWGAKQAGQPAQNPLQGMAPALETAPQPALQDYLEQKQRVTESYAWIDPTRQLARIPVDEAIRALAMQSATAPQSDDEGAP